MQIRTYKYKPIKEEKMVYQNASLELDDRARKYVLTHGNVTYADGLRYVLASDPDLMRRYNRDPAGVDSANDVEAGVEIDRQIKNRMSASGESYESAYYGLLRGETHKYENTATTKLGNIVASVKLPDNRIDIGLALKLVANVPDLVRQAAEEKLASLAGQWVENSGLLGTEADRERALVQVRQANVDLASAERTGTLNESALETMYPQFFK